MHTSSSRIANRATIAGVTLTETQFSANARLAEHHHEHAFFCMCVGEEFEETTGGRLLHRTPGDVVFHPPGETHADAFRANGGACFNIEYGDEWTERLRGAQTMPALTRSAGTAPAAWYAYRLLGELRSPSPSRALAVEGFALLLLAEGAPIDRRYGGHERPRWLRVVRDYLHDRYLDAPSLSEVARLVGVHPVHVARAFRRTYGCSVGSYVRQLRVDRALYLLASTSMPLVVVSAESGFADQSHLTRELKRAVGMTPRDYRGSMQGR